MATKKLLIENDYEFSLIGISSHSKDYRLCWNLNNQLQTKFEKRNDLKVELIKQHEISLFSIFEFEDEDNFTTHFIISNNGSSGMLLPEHKNLDYFWMIKGFFSKADCKELMQKLSAVDAVITSLLIDVPALKSKQNLIF